MNEVAHIVFATLTKLGGGEMGFRERWGWEVNKISSLKSGI
jgi:hypothetical protein